MPYNGDIMSTGKKKEIVRRLVETVWNQGEMDVADELIAPNYVYYNPSIKMEVRGPEGYKSFVSVLRSAYSEIEVVVNDLIAEADRVVMCWSFQGSFQDITKNSIPVTTTSVTVYRIENGKIVEERSLHDALGLLQQLGVISI